MIRSMVWIHCSSTKAGPRLNRGCTTTRLLLLSQRAAYCYTAAQKKRVAVIGAGPAGLATTRQLAAEPGNFEVTCFERKGVIGGEWNYTDKIESEDGYRQTGLYPTLRLDQKFNMFKIVLVSSQTCCEYCTIRFKY